MSIIWGTRAVNNGSGTTIRNNTMPQLNANLASAGSRAAAVVVRLHNSAAEVGRNVQVLGSGFATVWFFLATWKLHSTLVPWWNR